MADGLFPNNFTKVFNELIQKSGASCYKISKYAHIDEPYINRLAKGEKNNPSSEIVIRIGFALSSVSDNITIYDLDELIKSVGHTIFPRNKHP